MEQWGEKAESRDRERESGWSNEKKEPRCSNELVESVIANQTQIIKCKPNVSVWRVTDLLPLLSSPLLRIYLSTKPLFFSLFLSGPTRVCVCLDPLTAERAGRFRGTADASGGAAEWCEGVEGPQVGSTGERAWAVCKPRPLRPCTRAPHRKNRLSYQLSLMSMHGGASGHHHQGVSNILHCFRDRLGRSCEFSCLWIRADCWNYHIVTDIELFLQNPLGKFSAP